LDHKASQFKPERLVEGVVHNLDVELVYSNIPYTGDAFALASPLVGDTAFVWTLSREVGGTYVGKGSVSAM